jgi:pyridoxine 5-phosphate synthase
MLETGIGLGYPDEYGAEELVMRRAGLKLGVNIDHVATLRQQRGTEYPGVVEAALLCEAAGADGITVHLREDRRHIQDGDVRALRRCLKVPVNLEMAANADIVRFARNVRPDDVCLVPERRREITTEGGLDVTGHFAVIRRTVDELREAGIVVSLFVDPEPRQIEAAAGLGATHIELHTGAFCDATGRDRPRELRRLIEGAQCGHALGLCVNAGHGINYDNIRDILQVPHLDTLNIGHSIVSRAIAVGLKRAVQEMRRAMQSYRRGR